MVSKTWVLTLNNYTDQDITWVENFATQLKRIVVTKEIGDSGTPHLQGFMTFGQSMRLAGLKKLNSRVHWEPAKAAECAAIYPIKVDSDVVVNKNETCPGSRTDLDTTYEYVEEKKSMKEFMREQKPNIQNITVFRAAKLALTEPRRICPIEVIWRWGPTGVGKTRWCYDNYPDLYRVPSFKWWDCYDGQLTILIDDFRANWCHFNELLSLLDIYPYMKEVKGGWTHVLAERILITAPDPPDVMFSHLATEDVAQLLRRVTSVVEVQPPE